MRSIEPLGLAQPATPPEPGPAPMLQWIPVAELVVDDAYQRPIANQGRRNVAAIAARFRWSRFAPVVVSPVEGGRYAIVDGQHRATAALLAGVERVPCMVTIADQAEQAAAFGAINAQVTRMTSVQLHRAGLAAGEAAAVAVDALCRAAGVTVMSSAGVTLARQNGKGADKTSSVAGLARVLERHGEAIAALALRARSYAARLAGPSSTRS